MKDRLSASEVLDAHRKLRDGLADPDLARVRSAFTLSPGGARDVVARAYHPARDYAELHELIRTDLAAARTYQVTAEMVDTVIDACEEAGQRPLFLTESQLPCSAGFV